MKKGAVKSCLLSSLKCIEDISDALLRHKAKDRRFGLRRHKRDYVVRLKSLNLRVVNNWFNA